MNRATRSSFFRNELPSLCDASPGADAGFALPDASLACLRAVIARLGVTRVFEFGSGRSTRLFLDAGCEVGSVEDSAEWLAETKRTLAPDLVARWQVECTPLQTMWHRGVPFQSWRLSSESIVRLAAAELVLIDSPALPPFREHALLLALHHARRALVVVDDANIPTVSRFCARLAAQAAGCSFQARLDHGLFFLMAGETMPSGARGVLETLKAWRRYAIGACFPG